MSSAPKSPRATLDELAYVRDQGQLVELIDGELVHEPMRSPAHGSAQLSLSGLLGPFSGPHGRRGPGGWWLLAGTDILYAKTTEVFRHDLVGFRRELTPRLPERAPVKVRPDWACEVLSPSTARNDVVKKQRTLHVHGVPHYWLVDPQNQLLSVLRWEPDQYRRVLDAGIGDVVRAEPFDAIELDVRELFGVEDER